MERLQPNSITLAIYKKKCYNNKNNKTVISMENSPNIPHAGSPELPRVFSLAETGEVAAHTAQETKQKMEKVSVALRMQESQKCAKELHERVTKEVVAYVDSFLATDAGRKLSVQMSAARDMRAINVRHDFFRYTFMELFGTLLTLLHPQRNTHLLHFLFCFLGCVRGYFPCFRQREYPGKFRGACMRDIWRILHRNDCFVIFIIITFFFINCQCDTIWL
jgi:hypothetical protein